MEGLLKGSKRGDEVCEGDEGGEGILNKKREKLNGREDEA